ncbi:hypothetical protein BC349_14985 [Flavihumibacter stibioxidans]|uniref:Uncharacterized protein n=1 Tax=Flavihumibacter stibioxidans TaxID=1834163 RepID=A0ABR7MBF9_9BACT|nr:hypothetical protein [Flavihumibacter stibioxidans]
MARRFVFCRWNFGWCQNTVLDKIVKQFSGKLALLFSLVFAIAAIFILVNHQGRSGPLEWGLTLLVAAIFPAAGPDVI